jgi:hypothetical protein
MSFCTRLLLLAAIPIIFISLSKAQALDRDDTQSWNDVQLTVPLHDRVDLVLQGTARFTENITRFNEGRGGAGLAFKIRRDLTVGPGYQYIESRNLVGDFRTEHRFSFRVVYKLPVEFKGIEFSHRSQYEYRARSAIDHWRYRPSITIERQLPEKFLAKSKVFVTEEPFYSSLTKSWVRNRLSAGVSKAVNDHLTLEVYYLRQNDGVSVPGDLHVIGTNWKFKL